MSEQPLLNRYPGANSFTTEQEDLFMGREKDTEIFYQLIHAHQLVILYGKSGYGKSSLINAGVVPRLEKEALRPTHFSVRLFNKAQGANTAAKSPLNTLVTSLASNTEELAWMQPFKQQAYPRGVFWYWVKQYQYYNENAPIFLFFDQFEELFTYTETEIEDFASELGMVLFQKIPDFLRKKELFTHLSAEEMAFIHEKPNVKLVFSIRSDRMALLNRLSKYLPNLLKHHYELDALDEDEARKAIIKPASLVSTRFKTQPFRYEKEVIDAILRRVKNVHDGKVETAALQIICRFLEEEKVLSLGKSLISLEVLGNIKDIFKEYYQASLNTLAPAEKEAASKAIEEKFIQNNQRIPFEKGYIQQEYALTDTTLDALEKSTLLRKEQDAYGRLIYEIGHDTLIEPILEFAEIRRQENALRQAEALRKEEAKKRKIRNRNAAIIAGISLVGLVVSLFFLYKATQSEAKAIVAQKEALVAQAKADTAAKKALISEQETRKKAEALRKEKDKSESLAKEAQKAAELAKQEKNKAEEQKKAAQAILATLYFEKGKIFIENKKNIERNGGKPDIVKIYTDSTKRYIELLKRLENEKKVFYIRELEKQIKTSKH